VTQWTQVTEEVAEALAQRRPVVALETTLVSHGFSDGLGLAAATESERRVREAAQTGADVLAVCCPYEVSRFSDAVKATGHDELRVCDVIELVDEAMRGATDHG